jgi:hypothetical protein
MIKTVFTTFLIIVLVSLLNSCATYLKYPQALYVHSISSIENPVPRRQGNSNFYFYDRNDKRIQDKAVNRNEDSVVNDISIYLVNSETSFNSFSASWYLTQKNSDTIQSIRQPGIPNNIFSRNNKDSSISFCNNEILSFSFNHTDTTNKLSYQFDYESENGYVGLNEITVSHEGDSISYERILEISPEIIEFFRHMIFKYGDSIELLTIPALPDLGNCSLKESRFTIIESCNNSLGNKTDIYIDSIFIDGFFEVTRKEDFYFLYEENDLLGGYKYKRYTSNQYLERHFLPNEVSPFYELIYYKSPNNNDTTFKSEMMVSRDGRLDCYKLVQNCRLSQKSGPNDLREPIVKREMYFWINTRKQSIVRKRYVAYTEQNHQLEKEWLTSNKYKTITLLDTIPAVSGNQKYDIVPEDPHEPQYPYFNSLSIQKHKSSRKTHHDQNKQLIKSIRKRSTQLEKDRSIGYEKRISSDSYEMYEIYYLKKK